MKKFYSALGFILSIPAFISIFTKSITVVVVTLIITTAAYVILNMLENIILKYGNNFINKIIYYFTKDNGPYKILNKISTYEYINKNEMKFTKKYILQAKMNDSYCFDDRYRWSGFCKNIILAPLIPTHEITKTWEQYSWNYFTICFNKFYKKGEKIETGALIYNLIDEEGKAKPFLSMACETKYKEAQLIVKIPKHLNPNNANLEIYGINSVNKIASITLEYDERIQGYYYNVLYPRVGWSYIISWEFT